MTLLNHLQFQEIDQSSDDIPIDHRPEDGISLDAQLNEDSLVEFWDQVVSDIHKDPEWFKFDGE